MGKRIFDAEGIASYVLIAFERFVRPLLIFTKSHCLQIKLLLAKEADIICSIPQLHVDKSFNSLPPNRLKSRLVVYSEAHEIRQFILENSWREEWKATREPTTDIIDPTILKGLYLPHNLWCQLNQLRTGHGSCNYLLHKWGWKPSATYVCSEEDHAMDHIIHRCPIYSYQGLPNDLFDLPARTATWLENLDIDL
ncbi:jg10157 [Pararge aegeria aegeria]|uniref:Jg10157 protein n=1 Tax=Pararge aegeria aegeria TaxID=348720 RepID=A0A8S4R943_9NEOP|nr:jg10157 [Pararge aegeria aegeria]